MGEVRSKEVIQAYTFRSQRKLRVIAKSIKYTLCPSKNLCVSL